MERNISNMPVQKLPMSKKTEEWRRDCVDYFIGISGFSSANSIPDEEELQSYYDLYNSIYNTLSIDYNMFLYKNKNGSGYMEKKVNLEQKIIDLKLKKRELVLAGKNTSDVDEEIKKIKQELDKESLIVK